MAQYCHWPLPNHLLDETCNSLLVLFCLQQAANACACFQRLDLDVNQQRRVLAEQCIRSRSVGLDASVKHIA